jgi:DNA-binding transcriptional regulator YhcF (GntR family)
MNGYIKLFRQFVEWEWYTDVNTKTVFLHCLMMANFKEKKWRGETIKRGQFITSLSHLSAECGVSIRGVRTALEKLEKTKEIIRQSTKIYTVITICKYDSYQTLEIDDRHTIDTPSTQYRQTSDTAPTTTEERKKDKNEKNIKDIINNIQKPNNFDIELFAIFKDFLQMRKEIKKPFKSVKALETRINTLSKDVDRYGLENVKEAVKNSIANQYQGIFVKGYLDNKGEQPQAVSDNYTPPYTLPNLPTDELRLRYFIGRFEKYRKAIPGDKSYLNTKLRHKAIYEKQAEKVCYELEQKYPELTKIEMQWHVTQ